MRVLTRLPCVQRSTGCTEPASVALAAALAARAVASSNPPHQITITCDQGTYRNGLRAGVPGASGRAGLGLAAALGALAGDPDRRLEALVGVTPADVDRALALVEADRVSVAVREGPDEGLWIEATVEAGASWGGARLVGDHTRVVELTRDLDPLPLPSWAARGPGPSGAAPRPATLDEALALADALDEEDEAALLEGMETNVGAALVGGRGPGSDGLAPEDEVEAMASAASLARMSGCPVAVVTSGWSGNQGLVATLPIEVVGRRAGASRRELARALATSHLVARLLRERAPSPLCHALVAASAGAAAGCVQLLGGGRAAIERACHLVIGSAGAAACDGAKPACSLRVGLGAVQAVRCARRALEAPTADLTGGLVGATLEDTARALAEAAARLTGPASDGRAPSCER